MQENIFKKTKKNKQTFVLIENQKYVFDLTNKANILPLELKKKNHKKPETQKNGGWEESYYKLRKTNELDLILWESYNITNQYAKEYASDVIIYYEKVNNKPIAMIAGLSVFSLNNDISDSDELANKMNHATRRNFLKEAKKRDLILDKNPELFNKIKEKLKNYTI